MKDNQYQEKNSKELLTREETAQMLSMTLVTLSKFTKKGIISAMRIGSKIRYKKSDVLKAINNNNQSGK